MANFFDSWCIFTLRASDSNANTHEPDPVQLQAVRPSVSHSVAAVYLAELCTADLSPASTVTGICDLLAVAS